jgi:hypothetical protein
MVYGCKSSARGSGRSRSFLGTWCVPHHSPNLLHRDQHICASSYIHIVSQHLLESAFSDTGSPTHSRQWPQAAELAALLVDALCPVQFWSTKCLNWPIVTRAHAPQHTTAGDADPNRNPLLHTVDPAWIQAADNILNFRREKWYSHRHLPFLVVAATIRHTVASNPYT